MGGEVPRRAVDPICTTMCPEGEGWVKLGEAGNAWGWVNGDTVLHIMIFMT